MLKSEIQYAKLCLLFVVCRKVTESARIGSILNSVFKTFTGDSTVINQRAKSSGYFSANNLQTLSLLTVTPGFIYL